MNDVRNQNYQALQTLQEIASLTVWRSLRERDPLAGVRELLNISQKEDSLSYTDALSALTAGLMLPRAATLSERLFEALLYEDTAFSLSAGTMDKRVRAAALKDLSVLRKLLEEVDLPREFIYPSDEPCVSQPDLFGLFLSSRIESLAEELENFYLREGSGIFARYRGFILQGNTLEGIPTDPVTFADLIGYRREREMVVENTLHLLKGLPSNNMLLYGDRGTGKSTTVKALLNEFGNRGLRILQLSCGQLFSLPAIIRTLEGRRNAFILFIDDLSFNGESANYTALKSVLEGSLSVQPKNVAIYATSNRRHLVGEQFTDRDNDVHAADTLQEKLSLADRFGITVTFSSPDQEQYLEIVWGLLEQRGLAFDREEVRLAALRWEMRQNGLSPRTARQFADWQEARLKNSK